MHKIVQQDDSLEQVITKNILHVIENNPAEIAFAALSKVMFALIVGLAENRPKAEEYIAMLEKHLKEQLSGEAIEFGYLVVETSNNPILGDKPKKTYPLEWRQVQATYTWVAAGTDYRIRMDHGDPEYYFISGCHGVGKNPHLTLEEAQAYCQADHDAYMERQNNASKDT